jgi:hypothetical protein
MATESRNKLSTLSQTRSDTLPALVRRLRGHAKTIKNRACQAMSQDMLAAALAIEQRVILADIHTDVVDDLTGAEAMALARLAERFLDENAARFLSGANDAALDALLGGIEKLRSALAGAGFTPH